MTTNYQILTDSSCDLPASLARTLGVSYAPLRVQFQGAEYENFLDGDPRSRLEMKAFYKTLRTGAPTSTTAVNPEGWSTLMAPILAAGQDLLILAFSSGLSSTYAAAVLAAQELAPQYPGRTIRVVDTLCASMGQGLLVYRIQSPGPPGLHRRHGRQGGPNRNRSWQSGLLHQPWGLPGRCRIPGRSSPPYLPSQGCGHQLRGSCHRLPLRPRNPGPLLPGHTAVGRVLLKSS